jgi:hypothetical protein
MTAVHNGMLGDALSDLIWRKSQRSGPSGNCVELAELPGGEIAAFFAGVRDGEFDGLTP